MGKTVAVDWGTTSFRAYLLDGYGNIMKKIRDDCGILGVVAGDFEKTLIGQLSRFCVDLTNVTVICCGMVTSRNGWLETEYIPVPARPEDIAAGLSVVSTQHFRSLYMVPGLCQNIPHPDVIRGEESQLIGLDLEGPTTVILPGSHSKWVALHEDKVESFLTCMTGEVFAAVSKQTILRVLPESTDNEEEFLHGVKEGFTQKGARFFSSLFQVRGRMLLLGEKHGREYLSGFFLGTEIAEAVNAGIYNGGGLLIVGREDLARAYHTALAECGFSARCVGEDVVAKGLWKIAKLTGRQ